MWNIFELMRWPLTFDLHYKNAALARKNAELKLMLQAPKSQLEQAQMHDTGDHVGTVETANTVRPDTALDALSNAHAQDISVNVKDLVNKSDVLAHIRNTVEAMMELNVKCSAEVKAPTSLKEVFERQTTLLNRIASLLDSVTHTGVAGA